MQIEYFLFVLLGFGASVVSAVFGFGTALIVLAVGSHLIPVKEAIVLGAVLFFASTVFKIILFSKLIDWKLAGIMSVVSLPFAYAGALLLPEVLTELLRRLLGAMILSYIALTVFNLIPAIKVGMIGLVCGPLGTGDKWPVSSRRLRTDSGLLTNELRILLNRYHSFSLN